MYSTKTKKKSLKSKDLLFVEFMSAYLSIVTTTISLVVAYSSVQIWFQENWSSPRKKHIGNSLKWHIKLNTLFGFGLFKAVYYCWNIYHIYCYCW